MKKIVIRLLVFIILTLLTQVGGVVYLLAIFIASYLPKSKSLNSFLSNRIIRTSVVFIGLYLIVTYMVVPLATPHFGREKINNTDTIQPTNYLTVLFNRNYVRPEINTLLLDTENRLKGTSIPIHYLDASFPFINKFPLLPHLSHNDGRKIDISLIYEEVDGSISDKQTSRFGYGVYVEPRAGEKHQPQACLDAGHTQYDYSKYLSLGAINDDLVFSDKGTKTLLNRLLQSETISKVFIEPHLKQRMSITDSRIRYHGCHAVRHDDHIHLQIK